MPSDLFRGSKDGHIRIAVQNSKLTTGVGERPPVFADGAPSGMVRVQVKFEP